MGVAQHLLALPSTRILVLKGNPHAVNGERVLIILIAMVMSGHVPLQNPNISHVLHSETKMAWAIRDLLLSQQAPPSQEPGSPSHSEPSGHNICHAKHPREDILTE